MRIKTTTPEDFDFSEQPTYAVKLARSVFGFNDRTKFASRSGEVCRELDRLVKSGEWHADDLPLHVYALGDYETYGFNRNGDGFERQTCRDFHKTFEKHAKFYRNHRNAADKDPHYGGIKYAWYNEPMGRIELLCNLYGNEKRARSMGGFVDDRALQKMAKDEPISTSMACKIVHDVCSACGNKARGRFEYCGPETCKAGGCKDNLGRIVELDGDVHHLGVYNPQSTWFDMSDVGRNADAISFGVPLARGEKSASTVSPSGLIVPLRDWIDSQPEKSADEKLAMVVLHALHQTEETGGWTKLSHAPARWDWSRLGVNPSRLTPNGKAAALAELASRRIVVPFAAYAELAGLKAAGSPCSFGDLLRDECPERFFPRLEKISHPVISMSGASAIEEAWSLAPATIRSRLENSILLGKAAGCRDPGEPTAAALEYAGYQVAALTSMAADGLVKPEGLRLAADAVVSHNRTN